MKTLVNHINESFLINEALNDFKKGELVTITNQKYQDTYNETWKNNKKAGETVHKIYDIFKVDGRQICMLPANGPSIPVPANFLKSVPLPYINLSGETVVHGSQDSNGNEIYSLVWNYIQKNNLPIGSGGDVTLTYRDKKFIIANRKNKKKILAEVELNELEKYK